ncbi:MULTISPECIES: heavy metal translocating P-type ATPase [unclassified Breznakia]|uniref:heavy metal translocating P-type ATPase n=1 Tax=unclassified Breznakia TaxID=2623764 RepID=UPI002476B89C|nr:MULTISPECIES: heavy metal translocating P-type ATPase [unclassified Breznakia]MDH6366669.1 Cu+-exporting ATPase [Breznakia sp. PH1-1]MDH6403762.1 Cu+-exporting ATPase [Breznakia sp. PF1-11]MDH6411471.1 Cu+-exporting ATPase [Breznakia sp. PFB1-11]MDH6413798.1 Cu+-exporting ATPase [Breznakia sp. PFB1-14]MDH6416228.1 Cu+-exporting ATPase [Breznakia sp. PFB1-4]
MKQKIDVTGMTCSACAAHVEKAVKKLPGTKEANVNLMQNKLLIDYDPKVTSEQDISGAIEAAGYGVKKEVQTTNTENQFAKQAKQEKRKLWISVNLLIVLMYISMGSMVGLPLPSFLDGLHNAITFAMVQFLLTLIILSMHFHYFKNGFKALIHRAPTMDSLIALGSSAALLYGIYAIIMMGQGLANQDMHMVHTYHMDLYFESAAMIVTLISVGKYLETRSKGRTNDAIQKLMDLTPKTAFVQKGNQVIEVAIEDVQKDDILIVKTGASIPVDGKIIEGNGTLDEALITGESIPVEKHEADKVIGGTILVSGYIKMQALHVGEDTTIAKIIQLVEDANASKAPIAKLADKVSAVFVPIVIAIATIATITWLALGYDLSFSLSIGIAVLIISCPCALGLATPTAIMVATGKGAQLGILFKNAESLEQVGKMDTIVLDKTGTLTKGKPEVTDVVSQNEMHLYAVAYALEHRSEHPLAKAIINYTKDQDIEAIPIEQFEQIAGQGIKASSETNTYFAGNAKMMEVNQMQIDAYQQVASQFANEGKTVLYFAENNQVIGLIALADVLKDSSIEAIAAIKQLGKEVVLLTGDNKQTAAAISKKANIDTVIAEVLPQDKEEYVRKLQTQGKQVAMVGDGINDAPALARADVGIAIGAGTEIAMESADVILMHSDLMDVATSIQLSKATIRNIKQNLFWAFFYNAIGIPLAAGLFYPAFQLKLNPMFGSAAMSLSSLFVVSNALRLRFFKPTYSSTNVQQHEVHTETIEIDKKKGGLPMNKVIHINGMMCANCERHVNNALNALDGVEAKVDLANNLANITLSKDVDDATLTKAVTDAGYEVTSIEG